MKKTRKQPTPPPPTTPLVNIRHSGASAFVSFLPFWVSLVITIWSGQCDFNKTWIPFVTSVFSSYYDFLDLNLEKFSKVEIPPSTSPFYASHPLGLYAVCDGHNTHHCSVSLSFLLFPAFVQTVCEVLGYLIRTTCGCQVFSVGGKDSNQTILDPVPFVPASSSPFHQFNSCFPFIPITSYVLPAFNPKSVSRPTLISLDSNSDAPQTESQPVVLSSLHDLVSMLPYSVAVIISFTLKQSILFV
jgi:hypothetical protein